MSEAPETTRPCAACRTRDHALEFFNEKIVEGEIGAFVNGLIEAIAWTAACHVMDGCADKELEVIRDRLDERYAHWLRHFEVDQASVSVQ